MASHQTSHLTAAAAALTVAVVFWGLTPVAIRYLVGYLSPPHLLLLRFSFSALLLIPFLVGFRTDRWTRDDVFRVIGCSLAGVAGYNIPVTYGSQWAPAGTVGLLIATEPIWIVFISAMLLGDRPRWTLLLGLVLSGTGVAGLVGLGDIRQPSTGPFVLGVALVLLGAFMWAVYCILIPPLSHKHGAIKCTAITGILGLAPLYLLWDSRLVASAAALHTRGWIALVFLAVCSTVIATILWNYGLGRIRSAQAGMFLYLIPLVSVIGGSVMLREQITLSMLVSGVMIIAGVGIAQVHPVVGLPAASKAEGGT